MRGRLLPKGINARVLNSLWGAPPVTVCFQFMFVLATVVVEKLISIVEVLINNNVLALPEAVWSSDWD